MLDKKSIAFLKYIKSHTPCSKELLIEFVSSDYELNQAIKNLENKELISATRYTTYTTEQEGVEEFHGTDWPYSISSDGLAYLESLTALRRKTFWEWIRYIITTTIAIAALVLAGISLAAQLGLITLPKP